MSRRMISLAAVLLFCTTLPLLAGTPKREGKWETTMTMDMPNMPVKMKPVVTTSCVTKEDLQDPSTAVPRASKDDSCKVSDYKVDGQTVSWKITCEGKNPTTGTGEMTYKENTFEGTMKMLMGDLEMNMKLSGKRLGDCTPAK